MIFLTQNSDFSGRPHAVLPVAWDDDEAGRWRISVCDPSDPQQLRIITVRPNDNTFHYQGAYTYRGGEGTGGKTYALQERDGSPQVAPTAGDVYAVTIDEETYQVTVGAEDSLDDVLAALAAAIDEAENGISAAYDELVITLTGPADGTAFDISDEDVAVYTPGEPGSPMEGFSPAVSDADEPVPGTATISAAALAWGDLQPRGVVVSVRSGDARVDRAMLSDTFDRATFETFYSQWVDNSPTAEARGCDGPIGAE